MSADSTALLIAAAAGALIGLMVGFAIMGVCASRSATRAERAAWRAANLYYSRKEAK